MSKTTDGTFQDFKVKTGVRQGCVTSSLLFNSFIDRILREVAEILGGVLCVCGVHHWWRHVPLLLGPDQSLTIHSDAGDPALTAETKTELQHVQDIHRA